MMQSTDRATAVNRNGCEKTTYVCIYKRYSNDHCNAVIEEGSPSNLSCVVCQDDDDEAVGSSINPLMTRKLQIAVYLSPRELQFLIGNVALL